MPAFDGLGNVGFRAHTMASARAVANDATVVPQDPAPITPTFMAIPRLVPQCSDHNPDFAALNEYRMTFGPGRPARCGAP